MLFQSLVRIINHPLNIYACHGRKYKYYITDWIKSNIKFEPSNISLCYISFIFLNILTYSYKLTMFIRVHILFRKNELTILSRSSSMLAIILLNCFKLSTITCSSSVCVEPMHSKLNSSKLLLSVRCARDRSVRVCLYVKRMCTERMKTRRAHVNLG